MKPKTFLVIAALVLLPIVTGKSQPKPVLPDFPYLPGDKPPVDAWCNWIPYELDVDYCQAAIAGQTATFTKDRKTEALRSITYKVKGTGLVMGDLILIWGQPTAMYCKKSIRCVYWRYGSAIVDADPIFSPYSKILWLTFNRDDTLQRGWRGFRQSN